MQPIRKITDDILWVGGNDRRLALFENIFPLPGGITYNAYLIADEKTALLDTVDSTVTHQLLNNLDSALGGRKLDYLVIHHMEPDHSAEIEQLCLCYPEMQIVGNPKTLQFIEQFFDIDIADRFVAVKEGDELNLGKHTLRFYFAPMVHWPEVMFSYEKKEKILFSADAFGTFGAFSGNLFDDEMDCGDEFMNEARRYYSNIVGKYGSQVGAALKKLADVDIKMICSLHGPIWREKLSLILDKYNRWSQYAPEEKGVVIAYGSMYGHTEQVANIIASKLAEKGVHNIHMYDVSKTHPSYIIADIFRFSHLVLASPTYNLDLYLPMNTLMHDMAALSIQNRKTAVVANGTWAPAAHSIMVKNLENMKNMELIGEPFLIRSAFKEAQSEQLDILIDQICTSVHETKI